MQEWEKRGQVNNSETLEAAFEQTIEGEWNERYENEYRNDDTYPNVQGPLVAVKMGGARS